MKVSRVYYNDDDILVPGHLIRRLFHRPVFFPFERKCGFSYQIIHKKESLFPLKKAVEREFYKAAYPEGTRIKVVRMYEKPCCKAGNETQNSAAGRKTC